MEINDYIQIIFGAILGWLITIIQSWFSRYEKQKNVNKVLSFELLRVGKTIKILQQINSSNPHNAVSPSQTSLPLLENITTNDLIYLPNEKAKKIYELIDDLKKAENFRGLALQEVDPTKQHIYTTGYAEYIDSSDKLIKSLEN